MSQTVKPSLRTLCQLDHIISATAEWNAEAAAIDDNKQALSYRELDEQITLLAHALLSLGLEKGTRVGIYLPKQVETVISIFAISRAGLVFVPINPILKTEQVAYIIDNCGIELLITSGQRFQLAHQGLEQCTSLRHTLLVTPLKKPIDTRLSLHQWSEFLASSEVTKASPILPELIDQDLAAILYTSGSTGQPKGVCLSHRNLIAGAQSVSQYLANSCDDVILAVLPLSFDYGLSQVTTALLVGAKVVLMEYLLPRDIVRQIDKHQVTGLAAVPPLWIQLAQLEFTESCQQSLRYLTNSGGAMPMATLEHLRQQLPQTQCFLMYGLTEAFRSTYLDPAMIEARPDSIGKAIPNADVRVLRADGNECDDDEVGELVHRGVHVSLGYWNAPEKTAKRFKPTQLDGELLPEMAVWSGDSVRRDSDGFLYFVARQDDMIKSSGYRISPSELEDSLYRCDSVSEVAAFGLQDEQLGQAVVLVIQAKTQTEPNADLEKTIRHYCKQYLPNFMQPKHIVFIERIPRNANGKMDRAKLHASLQDMIDGQ